MAAENVVTCRGLYRLDTDGGDAEEEVSGVKTAVCATLSILSGNQSTENTRL